MWILSANRNMRNEQFNQARHLTHYHQYELIPWPFLILYSCCGDLTDFMSLIVLWLPLAKTGEVVTLYPLSVISTPPDGVTGLFGLGIWFDLDLKVNAINLLVRALCAILWELYWPSMLLLLAFKVRWAVWDRWVKRLLGRPAGHVRGRCRCSSDLADAVLILALPECWRIPVLVIDLGAWDPTKCNVRSINICYNFNSHCLLKWNI